MSNLHNEDRLEAISLDVEQELESLDDKLMAEIDEFSAESGLHPDDDLDEILQGISVERFNQEAW